MRYLPYFLCSFTLFGCFFGPSTFKDSRNYLLTDELTIVNTARKEKIKNLKIYISDSSTFKGEGLILDTSFAAPIDKYQIPFNKEVLNAKFVNIFITLTRLPGLFLETKPGDLINKRKIKFEGDKL